MEKLLKKYCTFNKMENEIIAVESCGEISVPDDVNITEIDNSWSEEGVILDE